jgi:hypothetical protein
MHQDMDVNVVETKGHRQGDPVKIGQDLIDQKLPSLRSMVHSNCLKPGQHIVVNPIAAQEFSS